MLSVFLFFKIIVIYLEFIPLYLYNKQVGEVMNIEYLLKKYSKLVYKICIDILKNPLDAEDMMQETYISMYKSRDKYFNLPENDLKNILCKIALNKCRDLLKSKLKKLENLTDYDDTELENYVLDNKIDENLYEKERKLFIIKMINELKNPYNLILYDYFIAEETLDNIAKRRNISKPTLKVQIYRGKKLLKEKIESNGGDVYL